VSKTPGRQYRKTKWPGVYVLHARGCPAELRDGPACACDARWKGRRRSSASGKTVWQSPAAASRAEVVTWLEAGEKGAAAVQERAKAGRTFESLGREWLEGVRAATIQRRRRGKPLPYSASTIPKYERDLEMLCDPERGALGERIAAEITDAEWQAIFDELRRAGVSYSRAANIKAVPSAVYAWASHRARRARTGVAQNPLRFVDLGANNGQRRERVALPQEAAELLAALAPRDQVPYAIAFYGGPRRGAIARLDWSDVQMVDGKPGHWLHIRPLEDELGPGKTGEGRWVPIVPQLRPILLSAFLRAKPPTSGPVCEVSVESGKLAERAAAAWAEANTARGTALGRRLRPRTRREEWLPEHALQPITLHECRHTYCSWLVASKRWDINEIQTFMGHALLSTTQRYIHTIKEHGPWTDLGQVEDVFGEAQV